MLIYASVMFTFRGVAGRNVPDRTALLERLAPAPEVVVDGLLARFTETPRGSAVCVSKCLRVVSTHVLHSGSG
jgi:DNA-directed RNA polymerase I subunit RPA49